MKIYIEITYNGDTVDAYEHFVLPGNLNSRTVRIEISQLLRNRLETIIRQAKRKLKKELDKEKAAAKKPTVRKPGTRKKTKP
ncbi:hypothetical protein ES703_101224 [subsurface metagenome]